MTALKEERDDYLVWQIQEFLYLVGSGTAK